MAMAAVKHPKEPVLDQATQPETQATQPETQATQLLYEVGNYDRTAIP
jgi:hypothetical protein